MCAIDDASVFFAAVFDSFIKEIEFKISIIKVKKMRFYKSAMITLLMLFASKCLIAQTEDVLRINFLNPAISYERSSGEKTTLEAELGFGYNASYPDLVLNSDSGFQYIIAPFLDVQNRFYYNFVKRKSKSKIVTKNSGNFVALRALYTGPSVASSYERYDDNSFSVGPAWGLQRAYDRLNLAFSTGPIYYFDLSGNSGWSPFSFEFNLGFNLEKKRR